MTYPTVSDLKTYMGITGSAEDGVLDTILQGMIESVEVYTTRIFVAESIERGFPDVMPYVTLSSRMLTLFDDLAVITTLTNGDGTVLTTADYDPLPIRNAPYYQIMIRANSNVRWSVGGDGARILVDGYWGYSTVCPADIFLAILELSQLSYAGRADGAGTLVTPQGLIVDKSKWPARILRVLDGKRRNQR